MKRFLIAFAAAILILTGTSLPAHAGTWTIKDRQCRSGTSGKICVDIATYKSGSKTTKHWRILVYPAKGKWIQPLVYGQHGDNMGEIDVPVCQGSCPRFTSKKIGKWRAMDLSIIEVRYKTPTGSYWVAAGRMTTKRSTCKTIVSGKVCVVHTHKTHGYDKYTHSTLKLFPKTGHTLTPRMHTVYDEDLRFMTSTSYCRPTCKPQRARWTGDVGVHKYVRQTRATYSSASGTSSITLKEY